MLGKLYKMLPLGKRPFSPQKNRKKQKQKQKSNHKLTEWRGSNLRACFWKIRQIYFSTFGRVIYLFQVFNVTIVNRGDWLWSPANIKGANKDATIYVGRLTTVHNLLLCAHTLCMNYVTNTFLLVSSSVRSKQLLCFVHGQGQKSEQKHTTKTFVGFHNHSPLLTMGTHRNTFLYLV